MADTTFQDYNTNIPIVAAWLQDINNFYYRGVGQASPSISLKQAGGAGGGFDNTAIINSAITALSVATGGQGGILRLYSNDGTSNDFSHSGTIIPKSNVTVDGTNASLTYTGSGVQMQNSASAALLNFKLIGVTLNFGNATTSVALNTAWSCKVLDVTWSGTSYTNTLMRLGVNLSGTANPEGNYNSVYNRLEGLRCAAICGTYVQLAGTGPVGVGTSFVTNNTISDLQCCGPSFGICVYGIDFNQWCDSNTVTGDCRLNLLAIPQAINAVGVIFNSQGPAQNWGVYDIVFQVVAIDAFGTIASDNRRGIVANFSAFLKIGQIYQTPPAAGGDITVGPNCYSFEYTKANSVNNLYNKTLVGTNLCIGAGQSNSYSIYLTNFTLTGANPASINAADTFGTTTTGTAAGITVGNSSAAGTTMSQYIAVNVANFLNGSGSSMTAQTGLFIPDLTAGTTSNWGIRSLVSAGTGKYNIYAPGTAQNFFQGDMQIAGGAQPILHTVTTVTSGAAAAVGTLTNAPVAGNPTKWIPFNDAGTTRYIPAW